MVEFYKFFSPSSSSRARISVRLHARGAGELDLEIINLLWSVGLSDVPQEMRQSLDLLDGHLKNEAGLPRSKRESIVSHAKELGFCHAAHNGVPEGTAKGAPSAAECAQEINDMRRFKAGLLASVGPSRPRT